MISSTLVCKLKLYCKEDSLLPPGGEICLQLSEWGSRNSNPSLYDNPEKLLSSITFTKVSLDKHVRVLSTQLLKMLIVYDQPKSINVSSEKQN